MDTKSIDVTFISNAHYRMQDVIQRAHELGLISDDGFVDANEKNNELTNILMGITRQPATPPAPDGTICHEPNCWEHATQELGRHWYCAAHSVQPVPDATATKPNVCPKCGETGHTDVVAALGITRHCDHCGHWWMPIAAPVASAAGDEPRRFGGLIDDKGSAIICVVPDCHRQADRRIDAGPVCKFHGDYVPTSAASAAGGPTTGAFLQGGFLKLSNAQFLALEDVRDCKVQRHWMADRYNARPNLRTPHKAHHLKVTVSKLITLKLVRESEKIDDWYNVTITDLGRAELARR